MRLWILMVKIEHLICSPYAKNDIGFSLLLDDTDSDIWNNVIIVLLSSCCIIVLMLIHINTICACNRNRWCKSFCQICFERVLHGMGRGSLNYSIWQCVYYVCKISIFWNICVCRNELTHLSFERWVMCAWICKIKIYDRICQHKAWWSQLAPLLTRDCKSRKKITRKKMDSLNVHA